MLSIWIQFGGIGGGGAGVDGSRASSSYTCSLVANGASLHKLDTKGQCLENSQAIPHLVRESLHDQTELQFLNACQRPSSNNISIFRTSENFLRALLKASWIEASVFPI